MATLIRFVSSISDTPTNLLDLNTSPLMVDVAGIDMSPPEIRRSEVQTFLGVDGDSVVDTTPEKRLLKIPVNVVRTASPEQVAELITDLHAQLVKPTNFLMVQLEGMAKPVFFQTFAAPDYSLKFLRLNLVPKTQITLEIPAAPYGYGPKVTLASRTLYAVNSFGPAATINGDFEADVTGWQLEAGSSTFSRSTAQSHAGVASMIVTPDGTTATVRMRTATTATTPGQKWHARAWLRPDAARTIALEVEWVDGGGSLISRATRSFSASANTWQQVDTGIGPAPANTASVRVAVSIPSTPPNSFHLYVDEVRLIHGDVDGSMYTDITGVQGDADTPLFLKIFDNFSTNNTGQKVSLVAMRKGGTPSNVPFLMESEQMSTSTDVSFLFDSLAGGAVSTNGQYMATTFATNSNLVRRIYTDSWPASWSTDLRGRYDVYVRVRGTTGNVYQIQMGWGNSSSNVYKGELITVPDTPTSVWFYLYLGTLTFPSGFDPLTDGYSGVPIDAGQIYFQIAVGRVSGANGFDIDTVNFFPADDESCLIKWPSRQNAMHYVLDGRNTAVYGLDSNGRAIAIDPVAIAGAVPMLRPGVTNRLFFARDVGYGTGSTQDLGTGDNQEDVTFMIPFYWPRYWMIRQATT